MAGRGGGGDLCWAFPPRLGGGVPSSFEDRTMTGPGEGGVLLNFARSRLWLCSEIHKNVANYVLSIEKLRNYVLSIEKSIQESGIWRNEKYVMRKK